MVLFFQGPRSFTGETCLEFQIHGGRAVVDRLLNTLSLFPETRHAEAGEFTRRAFEAGKVDLVEVEGLADLVAAETEMQRRLALEQANGGLTAVYERWAQKITHARAMIEAELDFSDEGDVPGSVAGTIWTDMQDVQHQITQAVSDISVGEMIRDGMNVVIYGRPNVGKSSLLNCLAGRDIAIVTHLPGTTRDVLTVDVNIDGYLVHFKDTAGIRSTTDVVEREGIRRAEAALETANLILHLVDLSQPKSEDVTLYEAAAPILRVGTKSDARRGDYQLSDVDVEVSSLTRDGIDSLLKQISTILHKRVNGLSRSIPSRRRHEHHLIVARDNLSDALQSALPLELRAESLRRASESLARLTGRVDTETILGLIFSEFCIGK
jgi:tRNA modification GTPase